MAEVKTINAVKRDTRGTSNARRLRVSGSIPAEVYGLGENQSIALDAHSFELMVRDFGQNFVGDLVIDGDDAKKVLLKDLQYEPSRGNILHADFVAISMTEMLQVSLPIELSGEAHGTVAGGLMEQLISELDIECLPGAMVETIVVDINAMEIGDVITVGDIKMPEGVTTMTDSELAVVQVSAPRVIEEDEDDAEEATDEAAAPAPEGE